MALPAAVRVTEVALRDGLQDEAGLVGTPDKLRLLDGLVDAGLRSIELGAFVRADAVPQMADTDELFARAPRRAGVVLAGLVLNERGARRAAAARPEEIRFVVSASEGHSRANSGRSVHQAIEELEAAIGQLSLLVPRPSLVGCVATAFSCPYDGRTPPEQTAGVAAKMAAAGVDRLILADTLGSASPTQVADGIAATAAAAPGVPIGLHLHDIHGMGLVNAWEAMSHGVDRFDSALGGIGGCPFAPGAGGNLATEDLVGMLEAVGVSTGVDLEKLLGLLPELQALVGHPLESHRGRRPSR